MFSCQNNISLPDFFSNLQPKRIFALTTKGKTIYSDAKFQDGDTFLFGCETRGLPAEVLENIGENCLYLPMQPESRSLNLSNTVAILLYEAWRQVGFNGAVIK